MPYDPSAFPPFAVTVDLVVLTVRRHALCALAVRRGEPPYQGRWALPGGFVRADEDLGSAAARELTEETGLRAHDRGQPGRRSPPRTARHLRRSRAGPSDAGRQRRPSRARARPALTHCRAATRAVPAGRRSTPSSASVTTALRDSEDKTPLAFDHDADPGARRGAGPFQDRVLLARHRLLPPGVHGRASCAGCTRRCGVWPSIRVTSTGR